MPKLFEEEGLEQRERFNSILERARPGMTKEEYSHVQSLMNRTFSYRDTAERNRHHAYGLMRQGFLNLIAAATVVRKGDEIDQLEILHNIAVATARNDPSPIHKVVAA
jgi:hypothetical protein